MSIFSWFKKKLIRLESIKFKLYPMLFPKGNQLIDFDEYSSHLLFYMHVWIDIYVPVSFRALPQ